MSFTASHGTTIKYIRKEDKVIPVFASGEYICDDGTWTEELEYSSEVQNGAMHYVNQMKQYLHLYNLVNSEVAFKNCLLWGVNPQKKHIEIFRTFTAKDLGETQHFVSKKYNKLWGKYSIINGFWKSTWKCGYMKSIMKLPLPYHKFYVTMRKRKD